MCAGTMGVGDRAEISRIDCCGLIHFRFPFEILCIAISGGRGLMAEYEHMYLMRCRNIHNKSDSGRMDFYRRKFLMMYVVEEMMGVLCYIGVVRCGLQSGLPATLQADRRAI